jgi:hypothetical protein
MGYEQKILRFSALAQVRQFRDFWRIFKINIFDVNQSEAIWVTKSS